MSKSELTSMISKRWREVDIETSQYCKKLSNAEKLRRSLESSCEGSASNAISSGASESTAVSDDSTTLTSISLIPTPIARSSKVDAEIDATLDDSSLELFETNSLEFNFSGGAV